jgi:hypothetical protein
VHESYEEEEIDLLYPKESRLEQKNTCTIKHVWKLWHMSLNPFGARVKRKGTKASLASKSFERSTYYPFQQLACTAETILFDVMYILV